MLVSLPLLTLANRLIIRGEGVGNRAIARSTLLLVVGVTWDKVERTKS